MDWTCSIQEVPEVFQTGSPKIVVFANLKSYIVNMGRLKWSRSYNRKREPLQFQMNPADAYFQIFRSVKGRVVVVPLNETERLTVDKETLLFVHVDLWH
jgi:hypothetical protein